MSSSRAAFGSENVRIMLPSQRPAPHTGGILASMLFGFLLLGCRDES